MSNNRIDMHGKRFGRLAVLCDVGHSNVGLRIWKCKCDCGEEVDINGSHLRKGQANSCGCLARELTSKRASKPKGYSNLTKLIQTYKGAAGHRGYKFELTREQMEVLTKGNCFYCGCKPSNRMDTKGKNGVYIYNGVDRVDNHKGYEIDNCVPCCAMCNRMKNNSTLQEFLMKVKRIYESSLCHKKI